MKKLVLLLVLIMVCASLFSQGNHNKVIKKIDQLLEKELKKEDVHNVFMSVYSPTKDFILHTAKGEYRDGTTVTIQNPYYTASVGKTFTATAIGLLVDRGLITFDDPISKYLSDKTMKGLHLLDDVDHSTSIKISHLLQHTSGLPDYFGETVDGSPGIFELIMSNPGQFWEPQDLISFSKAHFKPFFPPGTGYHYTDTEYVLLGLIIENISGMQLHEFLANHVFIPLEMNHTYLNQRSKAALPTPVIAEMYAGDVEISSFVSLSADWAGGAIVSTGNDLITFHKALMNGDLVTKTTLNAMQQWTEETKGMMYGFGFRKISFRELFPTLPKLEVIGHSGLNGTSMYYCPELDIYLAGTLNQLDASKQAVVLMVKVLMKCQNL